MRFGIVPGVLIGNGTIFGIGTVDSEDVQPGAVVVGAQQRIVNQCDMGRFYALLDEGRLFGAR